MHFVTKLKQPGGLFLFIGFIFFTSNVYAIPSFARQTNMPCSSCHTVFPELNSFGRIFKLSGYTLTGIGTVQANNPKDETTLNLVKTSPISAMVVTSFTSVSKTIPDALNNNASFPQEFSYFLGGQITPKMGGFVQVTYEDQSGSFAVDNADLRYANQTQLGDASLLYGVTLNNNPTVQDVWNSVPAWGFPYMSSGVAPGPMAAPIIEDGLGGSVAGLGAYSLWNNLIYAEATLYRSAQQGAPNPPDGSSEAVVNSFAPYWRMALQKQMGSSYVEIGTYGISADLYPSGVTGNTDTYTDIGVDVNYEKAMASNMLTVHGNFIKESRTLDASFAAGDAAAKSSGLNSFKLSGNYYLHSQIGFSGAYFMTSGDADANLYGAAPLEGSASNEPNSSGQIAELDYLPWLNTKFSVQYVMYNQFNGNSKNYDGSGRNASDNNALYVSGWIAF